MYTNFQQNRVSRSVKTVHTNLLQKFANCINLQLAIRISKNHAFRTWTTPSRTFRPILRSIGLLDNEFPRKENISIDDRRTDGQTSRTTTICSFFEKILKSNFLNSSPNESIPKFTNISLALLYFGKPSNLRKLLL